MTADSALFLFKLIFSKMCGTYSNPNYARNINIYKRLRGIIIYLRNLCCESISQWHKTAVKSLKVLHFGN